MPSMMIDEAIEEVSRGSVVRRREWPKEDFMYPFDNHRQWRSTRLLSLPDTVADDWEVVGRLN